MKRSTEIRPILCIFPDGVVKDRVCKEIQMVNDAATLEKLPGVDIAVEDGLQPTGTGYSAEMTCTGKKTVLPLLKCFSRYSTE